MINQKIILDKTKKLRNVLDYRSDLMARVLSAISKLYKDIAMAIYLI